MAEVTQKKPVVQVIAVKHKPAAPRGQPEAPPRTKVAAYCRVSTDHEEQESSYEAQCTHYRELISKNPDWELAGIYADEGISGLAVQKRPEFKKMIQDCTDGKIQLVITKSISRFARNTLDCLQYIRKLKAMGVAILFEKENILTTDAKGEILITIMASIAQQESASISQNVQMGVHYHFQQGKVGAGHQRFLGYRRSEDASLFIVPQEAKIVRRIFREYLEGMSPNLIARRLTAGRVTWRWNTEGKWHGSSIKYILQNEKYTGTLLLQKYYTVDYLTKKRTRNHGEVPQYLVENSHPPIIPHSVFTQTQGEMARRERLFQFSFTPENGRGDRTGARSNVRFLSGRMICSLCGMPYRRKKENGTVIWRCGTNVDKDRKGHRCRGRPVEEETVKAAVLRAFLDLPEKREDLVSIAGQIEKQMIWPIERELEGVKDEKLRSDLLVRKAEFASRILQVKTLLTWLDGQSEPDPGTACTDYEDFIRWTHEEARMEAWDEMTALRLLEKVVVYPEKLEIVFKAGVSIICAET